MTKQLPYVYTKWKHFTTKDGLPNDHIFAVKVHGDSVWVGTEDGLARINKRTGEIRTWKEKDGLPWRGRYRHRRQPQDWRGVARAVRRRAGALDAADGSTTGTSSTAAW